MYFPNKPREPSKYLKLNLCTLGEVALVSNALMPFCLKKLFANEDGWMDQAKKENDCMDESLHHFCTQVGV